MEERGKQAKRHDVPKSRQRDESLSEEAYNATGHNAPRPL